MTILFIRILPLKTRIALPDCLGCQLASPEQSRAEPSRPIASRAAAAAALSCLPAPDLTLDIGYPPAAPKPKCPRQTAAGTPISSPDRHRARWALRRITRELPPLPAARSSLPLALLLSSRATTVPPLLVSASLDRAVLWWG